jgi:hypothetical protein
MTDIRYDRAPGDSPTLTDMEGGGRDTTESGNCFDTEPTSVCSDSRTLRSD